MAVTTQTPFNEYTGNGTTTQFPYTFRIIVEQQLDVYFDGILQGSGFSVSGINDDSGGTVTFATAPGSGVVVRLKRETPLVRDTDFIEGGGLSSDVLDDDLDYLTMIGQEGKEFSLTQDTTGLWDAEGKRIQNVGDPTGNQDAVTKVYVDTQIDPKVAAAQAAQTGAETAETNAETAQAAAEYAESVAETHKNSASLSATQAANSEANAAGSATDAATSATQAANSATDSATSASAVGSLYSFDDSQVMSYPGVGELRFNNTTPALITNIAISAQTADSGNPDVSEFISTWADSTNPIRGHLILKKRGSPSTFAIFNVLSTVIDNTNWLQLAVEHIDGNGSWGPSEYMYVQFVRTGNTGDVLPDLSVGNIASPLVNLPLRNSLVPVSGVGSTTFTRSTTATCTNRYGKLQTYAINAPRFEKNGLLMESSSTNVLLQSEQVDDSSWTKVLVTIDPNTFTAPNDTLTADKIVEDTNVGYHYVWQSAVTSTTEVTGSVYLYKYSSKPSPVLSLYNTTDGAFAQVNVHIPTGALTLVQGSHANIESVGLYWRVSVTGTASIVTNTHFRLFMDPSSYGGGGATWLGVWGMQLEDRAFESSYIPTTTAPVTRAADIAFFPFEENHPNLEPGNSFTYVLDVITRDVVAAERVMFTAGFNEPGVNGYSLLRVNNASKDLAYYRSGSGISFIGEDLGVKARYGVVVNDDQLVSIYINGNLAATPKVDPLINNVRVNPTNLGLGCRATATNISQLNGHISNISIYDIALSDEEMRIA